MKVTIYIPLENDCDNFGELNDYYESSDAYIKALTASNEEYGSTIHSIIESSLEGGKIAKKTNIHDNYNHKTIVKKPVKYCCCSGEITSNEFKDAEDMLVSNADGEHSFSCILKINNDNNDDNNFESEYFDWITSFDMKYNANLKDIVISFTSSMGNDAYAKLYSTSIDKILSDYEILITVSKMNFIRNLEQ